LVVRENQSRRDLTKVAQYEVLGSGLSAVVRMPPSLFELPRARKETAGRRRNGRIEQCWQSLSGVPDQKPKISIVPDGTDVSFCVISQHFVLGYFH
jgi:hypothetical protein